jgi:sorting nexin-8
VSERTFQIVNLVSSRPRVSKLEFFVALALVALAQSGNGIYIPTSTRSCVHSPLLDVSIEQVAALSSQNTLPEPRLDIESLHPSTSTISHQVHSGIPPRSHAPAFASEDPWSSRFNPTSSGTGFEAGRGMTNGAPSSLFGSGMPKDWWKKQEKVKITIIGQQGFILNRYTVYEVATDVRTFYFVSFYPTDILSREVHQFLGGIRSFSSYGNV